MKTTRLLTTLLVFVVLTACDDSIGGNTGNGVSVENWGSGDSANVTIDPTRTRKNICVVYDGSGSMAGNSANKPKYQVASRAISAFVRSVPEDVNLGLIIFNGGIREAVPLGVGENNRNNFMKAVFDVQPGGGTPLKSSMEIAYRTLRNQAEKQQGYGEYWLVVVTDGEANMGEDPGDLVSQIVSESPVVIYTVGFDISGNHSLNRKGQTIYKEARNQNQLESALSEVSAESESFDDQTSFE